jgi:hypothetical protein
MCKSDSCCAGHDDVSQQPKEASQQGEGAQEGKEQKES